MSDEDLLVKIDEIVAKRFNEIIEGERAKMKAEVEASNAEKQRTRLESLQIAHPRSIFPEILRVPFLKLRV
jgi:hypothetical protein